MQIEHYIIAGFCLFVGGVLLGLAIGYWLRGETDAFHLI
jgi:hypothetical protein